MAEITMSDKQSSIEVSENAKGQFTFKAKCYFNEEITTKEEIVQYLRDTFDRLHKMFNVK